MQKILVTGGAGFIGSHLCDKFLKEGFYVYCVDNLITGSVENIRHLIDKPEFVFQHVSVEEIDLIGVHFDYIAHFASIASPIGYLKYPLQTMSANSIGTQRVLELARSCGARFLMASTSEVYGDPLKHPQLESYYGNVNPVGLRSCYDESKRFAETLTMVYHRQYELDTRIVRIFNTYGPRMALEDGRVIPSFIHAIKNGESPTVFGDGTQTRSFCYIDDLVEGIYRLMMLYEIDETDHLSQDKLWVHEPTNIGNPKEITINELVEMFQCYGMMPPVFREMMEDDPKKRKPWIEKAKQELGWKPKVKLEDGIRKTLEWFGGKNEEN